MSRQKIRNALSACRTPAVSGKALSFGDFLCASKEKLPARQGGSFLSLPAKNREKVTGFPLSRE
jgi:hypothetical protein